MDGNQQPGQQPTWQYAPDDSAVNQFQSQPPVSDDISWTASEFIAHHKSAGWFLVLGLITVLGSAIVWFVTHDAITVISIVAAAILLAAFARRTPRELQYHITQDGLFVGEKFYHFAEFQSFSIFDEGAFASISFAPLRRFAPMLSIYYAPQDEERIVAALSSHLPLENRKADMIDRLLWRIRF